MKQITALLLTGLVVISCSKSSSTSKGTDSTNPYSADYCTLYPAYCSTSGTTTSGSTTGTTTGGSYTTIPSDNSWTGKYNGANEPTIPSSINCSTPTGTGYDTRKGTITMAFQKDATTPQDDYSPAMSGLSSYTNVSSFLSSVPQAAMFLDTDSVLKVRFMPRPQPGTSSGSVYCYGRKTGSGSGTYYGYSKLSFTASLRPVNADGSLGAAFNTQYFTTNINTCSNAVNWSGAASASPYGVVLVINDVFSDQSCSYYPCTGWSQTTTTCWQMDVEVSVDGTKTF